MAGDHVALRHLEVGRTEPLSRGDGCDVVFTVRRRAGVDDAEFSADADAVAAGLAALRGLMQE